MEDGVRSSAKVLFGYQASDEKELSIIEGESVSVIHIDGAWTYVENDSGFSGFVPSSYLDLGSDPSVNNSTESVEYVDEYVETNAPHENLPIAVSLYDYSASNEGELTFKEDDEIEVIQQSQDGWFYGRIVASRNRDSLAKEGYFPANFTSLWEGQEEEEQNNEQQQQQQQQQQQTPSINNDLLIEELRMNNNNNNNNLLLHQQTEKKKKKNQKTKPARPARRSWKPKPKQQQQQQQQESTTTTKRKVFPPSPSRPPNLPPRTNRSSISSFLSPSNSSTKPQQQQQQQQHRYSRRAQKQMELFNETKKQRENRLVNVMEIPKEEIKRCKDPEGNQIVLGEGSFGKVFKCIWNRSGLLEENDEEEYEYKEKEEEEEEKNDNNIECAVKVVSFNIALETLEKEILVVKMLNHPSVVNVYGFSVLSPKKFGIVMELVEGGTLFDLIHGNTEKFDPVTTENNGNGGCGCGGEWLDNMEKWRIIKKMILSVHYLHSRNVIHRDIKSLNFLVSRNRKKIKICDFGLAKIKTESKTVNLQTGLKGTVRYMAAELSGERPAYGTKSDIYSLGMTIYEVVTHKIPFEEQKNEIQVLLLIMKGTIPLIPKEGVDPLFKRMIEWCLNKDPKSRPSTLQLLQFMKQNEKEFRKRNHRKNHRKNHQTQRSHSKGPKHRKNDNPQEQANRPLMMNNGEGSSGGSSMMMESLLICPLSGRVMNDPVILAESGRTYDRESIEEWLKEHDLDPMTKVKLKSKLIIPNVSILNALNIYKKNKSNNSSNE